MIRNIRIRGYKSLRDTELALLPKLVVLFGPNSAGKSNFLDCLDLLGHLAKEDTVSAAFQRHRGNRLSRPAPVRWFFSAKGGATIQRIEIELDLELSSSTTASVNDALLAREATEQLTRAYTRLTHHVLRYKVCLEYSEKARTLLVTDESLAPLKQDGSTYKTRPFITRDESGKHLIVKLERQAHPRYFALPRERTILSEISDVVNHPHIVGTARELASFRIYYVEPTLMRAPSNDLDAHDPGRRGEHLASFYHWLSRTEPKRFGNLVDNLRRLVPGIEEVGTSDNSEGFLELSVKETHAGRIQAALISEGTLRLLCLLGIAASPKPPAVVGYEEPENGVHPGRLREMLDVIASTADRDSGAQFFLTTHSTEVLRFFGRRAGFFLAQKDKLGTQFAVFDEPPLFWEQAAHELLGPGKRQA